MERTHRHLASLAVLAANCAGLALCAACGSSPSASDAGALAVQNAIRTSCDLSSPAACPAPFPHYSDIAPIVQRSCVPCHPGATADSQWPLTEYDDVAAWADVVQNLLCTYRMPPLDGGIPMTDADRVVILEWIQCGSPK